MMRGRICLLAALVLAVAVPAQAAIIVDDTANWQASSGNFDASGSDKLIVIATGEHGFNQTGNGSVSGIKYDGVDMIEAVYRAPIKPVVDDPGTPEDETVLADDTFNAIYYLDNPATSTGLIEVTWSSRGHVTVIALSGTAAGVGNTAISARDSNSVDLTTSAGSIVIGSYGMGGSGNTAHDGVTWDGDVTVVSQRERNWNGQVVGYSNSVAAGTDTYSFTDPVGPDGDGRTGAHMIVAEFLVPEPATMGLLALGGLALLRRRRR